VLLGISSVELVVVVSLVGVHFELGLNFLVSLGFVDLGFLVDALGLLFDMLDFLLGGVCHFKDSLLVGHRCLLDLFGFFLDLLGFLLDFVRFLLDLLGFLLDRLGFLLDLFGFLFDFLGFLLGLLRLFLGYLGFFGLLLGCLGLLFGSGAFFGSIAGASMAFSSLNSVFGLWLELELHRPYFCGRIWQQMR